MPQTLCLSKSTFSLQSLQISQKIEFTLSPPFIKIWKQVSIPLIIVSNPEGSHVEYEWLQNKNHKGKKIKGKENNTLITTSVPTNSNKPLYQNFFQTFSTNNDFLFLSIYYFILHQFCFKYFLWFFLFSSHKNNSITNTIKPLQTQNLDAFMNLLDDWQTFSNLTRLINGQTAFHQLMILDHLHSTI